MFFYTVKVQKVFVNQNFCCVHPKIKTKKSLNREICPKGADLMSNNVDPDQTAPLGAV